MASGNICGDFIKRRDRNDATPLHKAVQYNEYHFIKFLIEAGADINAKDKTGATPLNYFCVSMSRYLDSEYARDQETEKLLRTLDYLIEHGADINNKPNGEETLLYTAVAQHSMSIVIYLLDHGADINTVDVMGNTPLHIAVIAADDTMVDCLLEHHPDIRKNNRGQSPLDIANENELVDIVEVLTNYIDNFDKN
jgi:ankyrin repeat protein